MGDYFVCPRYPDIESTHPLWAKLIGEYEVLPRKPSAYSDTRTLGNIEIKVRGDVLLTSDNKVLKAINETEIIIVGGIFDGETMIRDIATGSITWQDVVYEPKKSTG
jgi:hypothetical protein